MSEVQGRTAQPESPLEAVEFGRSKTVRIQNWKLVALWLLMAALGVLAFQFQHRIPGGMYAPIFSVICLLQFGIECVGVAIQGDKVSLPLRPIKFLPAISVWRRSIPFANVDNITFAGSWLGGQVMSIEGGSGYRLMFFQDRKTRLRFVDVLKGRISGLRVYRYM